MRIFMTDEEREALTKEVESLEPVVAIALRVLERMSKEGKPIIQVCGPMTTGGAGNFKQNMKRFRKAIQKIDEQGKYLVFDQMLFTQVFIRLDKKREDKTSYW